MASNDAGTNASKIANKVSERTEKRLEILDEYINLAIETDKDEFMIMESLPEDMVIYRYINDSLQSWVNQFPILNDDISSRLMFYRLSDRQSNISSPLNEVKEDYSYLDMGPKWYLIKSVADNDQRIIAGLEINNSLVDDARRNENGVNPRLRVPGVYTILPLSRSGGSAVEINETPLFKIIYDSSHATPFFDNSILRWIAILCFTVAIMAFIAGHRTLKVYSLVISTLTLLFIMAFMWGVQMNGTIELLSPSLYADGPVLFSLGSLLLINTYITLVLVCTFFVRNRFLDLAKKNKAHRKRNIIIYAVIFALLAIGTAIYTHFILRSLLQNSVVSIELYRWNMNIHYSMLVYLSYTGLLFCILLMIQSLRKVVFELNGYKYDMLSTRNLVIFAIVCSLYFTGISSDLGFKKEVDRVSVWANRLSVDRDLSLEIQLRSVEESIAYDKLISAMTALDNTENMIMNRLSDYYFSRLGHSYSLIVKVFKETDPNGQILFNTISRTGTQIADGSRFFFITNANGHNSYAGLFMFFNPDHGISRMVISIEPNSNREDNGYYNILGLFSKPGDIHIPQNYSYAKYREGRLISYKGTYPFPTYFEPSERNLLQGKDSEVVRAKGYVHFMNRVSDDEVIAIARPKRGWIVYFISFSYLCLALSGLLSIFARSRSEKKIFKRNYFKARINIILFLTSFLILICLTIISIIFVYQRNEDNMNNIMSSKISTIQALVERQAKDFNIWQRLNTQEFMNSLENISNTTKCDITLYTPDGKVFRSTTPEVFERMLMGSRVNDKAYHSIVVQHQRYHINRESINGYEYWAMYAPIFNNNGEMIAIVGTPYTDKSLNFRREAFFHAALIINIFLLLLIGSLIFSTKEVNALFAPLIEIGRKMNVADVHKLEYIVYKREDEISSLVDAYNRMVKDLSESTRKLALAERDKAWSLMARQVAHEIKNPLTPIKLQIQRLIRLKQNGNPAWEERFDEVSAVVLEHIDILSDTANEFSTFAKLYSEKPVLIDLDRVLKDQLSIFDNKDNIQISYLGMEESFVMAPKPQLIRVFVNLITNAIQAVEIKQKELEEQGAEPMKGHVFIGLRNSTKDDNYYDIVFEDNGTGVSDENLDKLFTPNFTTKSSGTGLGLAICRNIIEKCDGEINYRKSYALGGASFVVSIPKSKA